MDPHRQGLIQAHLAVFLFGASALFAKTLSVSPEVLVCIRTLFAASTLGLLAFVNKESLRIPFRTLMRLALLGMCLLVHWWTFFYSIQISSVAIGLLGFSSFPVFVLLLEGGLLRKPLRQADFFLVLLSIGGLLLVVPEYSFRGQTFEGLVFGILSGLSFALLQVGNAVLPDTLSPRQTALYECLVAGLTLLLIAQPDLRPLEAGQWMQLVFLGTVCTAIAHSLFLGALKCLPALKVSLIATLEPLYGIILAFLVLGEVPSGRACLGGAVLMSSVIASLFVSNRSLTH